MSSRRTTVGFLARFLLFAGGGLALLQTPIAAPLLWPLKTGFADSMAWAIRAMGETVTIDGARVIFRDQIVDIIDECTGIYAAILLSAFIWAFPRPLRARLIAQGIALVVIAVVNWLRLAGLGALLLHAPDVADFAHDYLWQVVWAAALMVFVYVFASGSDAAPQRAEPDQATAQ